MPNGLLRGASRRVAAVSVAAVAVIAAAIGVSIWRYEDALARSAAAVDARHDAGLTQQLTGLFWHEHEAMNEYLVNPDPAILAEIRNERNQFAATSARLGDTQPADEARLRMQAQAANGAFYTLFGQIRGAAGTTTARQIKAVSRLAVAEVERAEPADPAGRGSGAARGRGPGERGLDRGRGDRDRDRGRHPRRAGRHRFLAVRGQDAGPFLRPGTGPGGGAGRLSELLGRLRSTSGVVGEVTGELRLAAKNAAAVTSEQSSAVAETSATIEELATTAGSIADNAHAVARVAERTGDTMRDMQDKVETIAQRALSLGSGRRRSARSSS